MKNSQQKIGKKKTYLEFAEVKVDGGGALDGGEDGYGGKDSAGRKLHDTLLIRKLLN